MLKEKTYKKISKLIITFLLIMVGLGGIFVLNHTSTKAASGINEQINYQGRLLDITGAVVADGTYNMEFKIYQDGTGCVSGGSSPCGGTLKWTETRTGSNKVTVTNGFFSVALGSVTAFGSSVDWNQDTLWLSINIGGTGSPSWDGEMLPFRRFTAVPYALNSKQLGGLDWSKFVQIAPSAVQSDTSTSSMVFLNKTGASGNILQLQKSGSDVLSIGNSGAVLFQNASDSTTGFQIKDADGGTPIFNVDTVNERVGIGTASPSQTLEVNGNALFDSHVAAGASNTINSISPIHGGAGYIINSNIESITNQVSSYDYLEGINSYLVVTQTSAISGSHFLYAIEGAGVITASSTADFSGQFMVGSRGVFDNYGSGNIGTQRGGDFAAGHYGSGTATTLNGINAFAASTGAVTTMVGVNASAIHAGAATTAATAAGILATINNTSTGTVTNSYGVRVDSATNSGGGTVTNNYGLYIQDQSAVGSTNSYNFYSAGTSAKNHFDGLVDLTTLGGANTTTYLCRNSSNQIASCSTTGSGVAFVQDGNSFGAIATLGTNDSYNLAFETGGTTRAYFDTSGHFLPNVDDTYDLGSSTLRWANLYLGPATLSIGTNGNDYSISYDTSGVGTLVFNEPGEDTDLRVESDTNTNMLFVDASTNRVGIGTGSPNQTLAVSGTVDVTGHSAFGANANVNNTSDILYPAYTFDTVLNVSENFTDLTTTNVVEGIANHTKLSPTANATALFTTLNNEVFTDTGAYNYTNDVFGIDNILKHQGSGSMGNTYGAYNKVENAGSGSMSFARGDYGIAMNSGSGSMDSAIAIQGVAINGGTGTSTAMYGLLGSSSNFNSTTVGTAYGVYSDTQNISSGTITTAKSLYALLENSGTGTMTTATNLDIKTEQTSTGTISTLYGIRVQTPSNSGTVTNNYGLYIQDQSGVGSTNSYNFYSAGTSAKNHFDGLVDLTTLGSANTVTYLCRNSSNQIASCSTTGTGVAFVQGGNSFGTTATLGTNDSNSLAFETGGTTRAYFDTSGHFLPNVDDTYDLGSSSLRWANLYLGPATLSIGTNGNDYGISYDTSGVGTLVFNESGDDTDLRVESDTNTNMLFVDASTNRVGIGTGSPNQELDVVGNAQISSKAQIGASTGTISECQTIAGLITGNCALDVNTTSTETTNLTYGIDTFTTITPSGATNTAGNKGMNQVTVLAGTQSFSGNNYGIDSQIYNTTTAGIVNQIAGALGYAGQTGAGSTVTDAIGVKAGIFQSAGTLTNGYGINVISADGTVGTNYGIKVDGQTVGSSDYGIRIDTADTQTLWVSGDANNTSANAGIAFGGSRDTNLYRGAADTLKTDDSLEVTADLAVNGGDMTTSATTFSLFNSTVTTANLFGAATTINMGAAGGSTITPGGNLTYAEGNSKNITLQSSLTGGARATALLSLTQANDATNNSTSPMLQITQSDTASTGAGISVTQSSTAAVNAITVSTSSTTAGITLAGAAGGTGYALTGVTTGTGVNLNTVTTGTAVSATGITTGIGLNVTASTTGRGLVYNTTNNGLTTGSGVNITGAAAGITADYTGAYINVTPTRTLTAAATRTDSGNFLNIDRANTVNNAGATYNVTGALVDLTSTCTQTAGTCADSARILNIAQNYASASGTVVNISSAGTGNLATLDTTNSSANGVSIDVQSSSSSQYAFSVTSNNGSTTGLQVTGDGHVGVGAAASSTIRFNVNGTTGTEVAAGINNGTSTGDILDLKDNGTNVMTVADGGASTFQNSTNSTTAFRVINSAASTTIFDVDTSNGRVGIGTASPGVRLDVTDSQSASNVAAITNSANAAGADGLNITAGENTYTTGSNLITFKRPDGTTIGTVAQNASTTVAYNTSSDARLKENITETDFGLGTVLQLKVYDYNYKADANQTKLTGFIAQELYKLFPGAVTVGNDEVDSNGNLVNPWAVDYGKLTPLLAKGIQDLNTKVDTLETKLNQSQLSQAVFSGGIVANDTEFQAQVTFDTIATFKGQAMFLGGATFNGPATFRDRIVVSSNTAGKVKIPAGQIEVEVVFSKPYAKAPIVNVTPVGIIAPKYGVVDTKPTGFSIQIDPAQAANIEFNWFAVEAN